MSTICGSMSVNVMTEFDIVKNVAYTHTFWPFNSEKAPKNDRHDDLLVFSVLHNLY